MLRKDTHVYTVWVAYYTYVLTLLGWANGALPYIEHSVSCADQVLC